MSTGNLSKVLRRAREILRRGGRPGAEPTADGGEAAAPRGTAALTIVRNEPFFLPLWIDYYGGQFGVENLLVLDNESDDGSTDDLPCRTVRVDSGGVAFDHKWLVDTASEWQARLLEKYDTVVCTDVDEVLVHPQGLRAFAENLPLPSVRATGYDLVQTETESAYNPALPIMAQRSRWKHWKLYDKTLVSRVPLRWEVGFHFLEGHGNAKLAKGLTLIHLHHLDREQARQRHLLRLGWKWDEEEAKTDHSLQWRLEGEKLDAWFEATAAGAKPVPAWLKEQMPF